MKSNPPFGLALHGGAGDSWLRVLTPAQERAVLAALRAALDHGYGILRRGGPALDAAVAAVVVLENSPHFNAGRGASRNRDGDCELDAAVMDGAGRRAGAVAGVRRILNPVLLARAVMERSGNVFLIGQGAETFASGAGFRLIPNRRLKTAASRREWIEALQRQRARDGGDTVGAVALDVSGNLAAATSTGGVAGKRPGRVGDAPVIGAGTFADNATCAISTTGYGEFFIRAVTAHDISARMEHAGASLAAAARAAMRRTTALGGSGGLVAIDRRGNVVAPFTTAAMPRAWRLSGRRAVTAIWPDPITRQP